MRIPAVVALGGVRCATRCRGQQPQHGVLGVRSPVSKTASSGALLLDCFMICGKNDRTMYRLGLLFEVERTMRLTEEEWVIERGDEEAEAGEECRICRIAVRRMVMYIEMNSAMNDRWFVC